MPGIARYCFYLSLAVIGSHTLMAADPFVVKAELGASPSRSDIPCVVVRVDVPEHHVLYASRFSVEINGERTPGSMTPAPVGEPDPSGTGAIVDVYTGRVEAVYPLRSGIVEKPVSVAVHIQGCSERTCFLPRTATFTLPPLTESLVGSTHVVLPSGSTFSNSQNSTAEQAPSSDWLRGVRIRHQASGYMDRNAFLVFLQNAGDQSSAARPRQNKFQIREFVDNPAGFLAHYGIFWTLLLVLFGGLLLNLTPCVLPMIPINLAIIGAGAQAGSRLRGLILGTAYGAGIAVVYGGLGALVVLTGSFFGAIQSSPFFNAAVAILFFVFGLSLFDIIPIDLTRFQRGGGGTGNLWAAALAGGFSALLSGACVAPVVAAVLLLSGTLYHSVSHLAILLPFMLGVGMAIPWPLSGAGLAVLPKPGKWMVWIKHTFGVLILLMAVYYAWLAVQSFRPIHKLDDTRGNTIQAGDQVAWRHQLELAQSSHKPLMLDFQASWCKNCHVMDRTTFRDADVMRVLDDFIVVRVLTERPDEMPAKAMVQAFAVPGLPCYIVLDTGAH